MVPKVADFGLSREQDSENTNVTSSNVGPIKWMSPEGTKFPLYFCILSAKSEERNTPKNQHCLLINNYLNRHTKINEKHFLSEDNWHVTTAIKHRQYSNKSDVWSFGVVCWEIMTAKDPYENMSPVESAILISREGCKLVIPDNTDTVVHKLMLSESIFRSFIHSIKWRVMTSSFYFYSDIVQMRYHITDDVILTSL